MIRERFCLTRKVQSVANCGAIITHTVTIAIDGAPASPGLASVIAFIREKAPTARVVIRALATPHRPATRESYSITCPNHVEQAITDLFAYVD